MRKDIIIRRLEIEKVILYLKVHNNKHKHSRKIINEKPSFNLSQSNQIKQKNEENFVHKIWKRTEKQKKIMKQIRRNFEAIIFI